MMLPSDLLMKAEMDADKLLPFILVTISGVVGFFLSRTFRSTDKTSERVELLREDVGKLKMINDAQWRIIDDLKHEVQILRDKLYEVKR